MSFKKIIKEMDFETERIKWKKLQVLNRLPEISKCIYVNVGQISYITGFLLAMKSTSLQQHTKQSQTKQKLIF